MVGVFFTVWAKQIFKIRAGTFFFNFSAHRVKKNPDELAQICKREREKKDRTSNFSMMMKTLDDVVLKAVICLLLHC